MTQSITDLKFLCGGDPEFFLMDNQDNSLVSAHGVCGGKKGNPVKLRHGAVQEDNIMLELNIKPSEDAREFAVNIQQLIREIRYLLVDKGKNGLSLMPIGEVDASALGQLPEMMEFGCEPDYNAWTGDANLPPELHEEPFRFAGGHIHCSVNRVLTYEQQCNIVKWFDAIIGVWCVLNDTSSRRAKVYGTPGRFRPTKYDEQSTGIEYRVPSNFFVYRNTALVFGLAEAAMHKGLMNTFTEISLGVNPELVRICIQERNNELARFIINSTPLGRILENVRN